jgi:hypothetical protein
VLNVGRKLETWLAGGVKAPGLMRVAPCFPGAADPEVGSLCVSGDFQSQLGSSTSTWMFSGCVSFGPVG